MNKKLKDNILIAIVLIITAYFTISAIVFAVRHPKMTDTERILHLKDSLLFRRIEK